MRFLKNCIKIAENGSFLEQNELGSFMKRDRTTHNIQTAKNNLLGSHGPSIAFRLHSLLDLQFLL